MEDDATRPEPGGVDPNDAAERLRQLEEEMQRLKEQLGAGGPAAEEPVAPAAEAEAASEAPESEAEATADPAAIAEAEDLVRRAMVAKRRGQKEEASSLFKEAEAKAPNAPAVLEALGDDLSERGQTKQAMEVYARAIKVSPGNVGLERKHANLALRLSGALTIEEQLRSGLSEGTPDSVASAKVAVLLSVFIPGLGQMVTNRIGLGITLLALWIAGWIPALTVTDAAGHRAISNLPGMLMGRGGADVPALVLLGAGLAILVHLSSIAEASMHVPKGAGRRPPVDRPKPPVDLPFE